MGESGVAPRSDVPASAAFDAWRLPVISQAEFAQMERRERLEYFASLALLAPTTHNTVPQRMRIDEARHVLHFALERRAILPHSDAHGRQATVSLGAVIENVRIAAEVYGFRTTMTLHSDAAERVRPAVESEIVPVASLAFERVEGATGRDSSWVDAMLRRKMVRAEFDERVKFDASVGARLSELVRAVHSGLTLHLISDAPTLLALGKFQELADSTVINRTSFARELADWFLLNDSDQVIGMRGREFGLSDEATRRFRDGLAGTGALLPDETVGFAKAGGIGMRSASAVLVVTAAKDNLEHHIAAGRAFEAMALSLTRDGFVVAMHAGITEVEAPNMALRGRLRTFERPTAVFRAGKPLRAEDGTRPHSSRPRLEDVLY